MAFPDLEAQRAVMGTAAPQMQQAGIPQYHQPFQQTSIPGMIIGALLSRSPAGASLMQNINAYRNRDVVPAMQQEAANRFMAIGTPAAQQAAQMLVRNPMAAQQAAQMYGGFGNWYGALQSEAQSQRDTGLVQEWMRATPVNERDPRSLARYLVERGKNPDSAYQLAEQFGKLTEQQGPLVEVADPESPTGTTWITREEAIGRAGKPPTGMVLESTPGGGFRVQTGVRGVSDMRSAEGLTPGTKKLVQEDLYKFSEQMQAINNVMSQYRREYLQLPEQLRQYALSTKEWLGGNLTPEQRSQKLRYRSFQSDTLDELNRMLNMLSGAAVTEHEMRRLKQAMPSMDDSPTDFEAKAYAMNRRIAQATARANYVLRKGLTVESIPVGRMENLIKTELDSYYQHAIANGNSEQDAEAIADQSIMRDFGVSYEDVMLPWE